MKQLFSRIEFWILIFFLVRLVGILNPPLEIGHNWRQVTGLMVARNFLEVDASILYPRVDDNNGESGIIGMEFPSLNYIHYAVAKLFGYAHWYGRIINLLVSSFGLLYFFKLLCLAGFKERIAFNSSILLATSIWFSFSRKMMPDTYCISLMLIALFYGLKYLIENKWYQLVLYTVISSLALLSKIPAGIYLVLIIPFVIWQKANQKSSILLCLASLIPLLLGYLWYFKWNFYLSSEFGNWYNSGKSISEGFNEIAENLGKALDNFYFDSFSSYVVFIVFLIGLFLIFLKREKKILVTFLLTFSLFLIYIFKSGYYFYHHNYYIIPFVPIMALLAGYALSLIRKKWLYMTIIFIGVGESIANQQHDFFIKKSERYKMSLETIMDKVSTKDNLILINGNGNPQLMYLSHRKGWTCENNQLTDSLFIKKLVQLNCKFIVIDKHVSEFKNYNSSIKNIFENDDFMIFKTTN